MATILVADDRKSNREVLTTLLGYQGHRLLEAEDGVQALTLACAEQPDLIITDILMPSMDGYELVRRLRADPGLADTPVIFYTAHYLEQEARALARSSGVGWILSKPCEPEIVLLTVDTALGRAPTLAPPQDEFDREHLRLLTDKLSEKVGELHAVNLRLSAIMELSERIALERDPATLLLELCHAARSIIGASYTVVAEVDPGSQTVRGIRASGFAADATFRLRAPAPGPTRLTALLRERGACRSGGANVDPAAWGLPEGHPPATSLLAVSIASPAAIYGWLCLTNKLGLPEFSADDERIATILATHVARIYENARLYSDVEQRTRQLEREVAEHSQAAAEVRALNQHLEERVAERTAELQAVNRELEMFAGSVSHDLRAPLRSMNSFSHILLDEHVDELTPEAQRYLRIVRDASARMDELVEGLLTFARVSYKAFTPSTVAPAELVRAVLDELLAGEERGRLQIVVGELPACLAAPDLLRQVFQNLLSNALKFTRQRSSAVIEISGRREEGQVLYSVRDNGAGFDMRYVHRLFVVFQRLHSVDEYAGSGIGLATVQRIIHRLGGHIWAEAAVDGGATFSFTLMAAPQAEGDAESRAPASG